MPSDAKESKDSEYNGDAKRGRAAFDVEEDETMLADDAKRPPMRASIGWGNETTLASDDKASGGAPDPDATPASTGSSTSEAKRGGRRRKAPETTSSGGERRNQKNRYFEEDDETTDIVEIPDLEEEEREPDITTMVAEAPRNTTRAVQSLKQLDRDIKFALPSAQSHGVDLHLLTSALCPERAVRVSFLLYLLNRSICFLTVPGVGGRRTLGFRHSAQ
ncbi:hypothetical protein DVH05_012419 [Phytophthora capsici]|nr:hypothetical protein DVH05_012419 [Phytophthora capsici]